MHFLIDQIFGIRMNPMRSPLIGTIDRTWSGNPIASRPTAFPSEQNLTGAGSSPKLRGESIARGNLRRFRRKEFETIASPLFRVIQGLVGCLNELRG